MTSGSRIMIVANPTSGRGAGAKTANSVAEIIRRQGISCAICFTASPGDAERIATDICRETTSQRTCIVACGGDGTIQQVAGAMANAAQSMCRVRPGRTILDTVSDPLLQSRDREAAETTRHEGTKAQRHEGQRRETDVVVVDPNRDREGAAQPITRDSIDLNGPISLALAPAGRCNDFARALGVSRDPAHIASIVLHGQERSLDLGRVNGRYFCTVATAGLDAEVTSYVHRARLPLKGTPAYLYAALRVMARYRPKSFRIDADFGVIERDMLMVTTANTCSYGGAIKIVPQATPFDGQLDMCAVSAVGFGRTLRLIPRVLRAKHTSLPEVSFHGTKRFQLSCADPQEIWADGEYMCLTPAVFEVVPGCIRIMLPK